MNDQVKVSVAVFCFVVMIYMLWRNFVGSATWSIGGFFGAAGIAILIGGVAGGVTYFIASKGK